MPLAPSRPRRLLGWLGRGLRRLGRATAQELWPKLRGYFAEHPPTVWAAFTPLVLLALVLFTRSPATNYIFDEQEALLANPYVNRVDGLRLVDAIHRDFWGLPPEASIGSYRPIPSLLWRLLWHVSQHPFFHHLYNIVFHALSGAILGSFIYAVSKRRRLGWLAGTLFVSSAILTEAVSGIVGIADVLGGLGAVLALWLLRLPAWAMPAAVFVAVGFGLFSKESAMVCVPLVPVAALLTAPALHPRRPARWARALLALAAALGAFVLYVELRKHWFPSPLPAALKSPLAADASAFQQLYRDLLLWFHQAPMPRDPLNNPLSTTDFPHRLAGALRVYWRGLVQVLFPLRLSGDYSFPQEPVPERLYGAETIAGGAMMVGPLGAAAAVTVWGWLRERTERLRLGSAPAGETDAMQRLSTRSWRWPLLAIGASLAVLGAAVVVAERALPFASGLTSFPLWPFGAAVLIVGLGLVVEGWRSVAVPMAPRESGPLRHAAPALLALGLGWLVIAYFPHSNIPVVLPTVRAERFWYFPVIGTSLMLALAFDAALAAFGGPGRGWRLWGRRITAPAVALAAFLGFQWTQTYRHAMDYRNDLDFWQATKQAVPRSAKAHLNYSVMKGARGDLETRLVESKIALELAPQWPMAHVYTGDTLCRMHRPDEAWPHYRSGFDLGPNERSLIALALQCLWDEERIPTYEEGLRALATKHPGSWVEFLVNDVLRDGEKHQGVQPKYRPRGYNEGPRK